MSPEIVLKRKHNSKADIWGLGILLYEMLHGTPPFEALDFEAISQQMKKMNIVIRDDLHPGTKAIRQHMLKVNENPTYPIDQVLNHPVITGNISKFTGPISQDDKNLLLRNYILNNGDNLVREFPQDIEKVVR